MATAGSIVIDLVMRTGMFSTDTARAEKRLRDMQKTAERAGKAMGLAFTALGGVVAAGLGAYVRNSIEAEKVQAQLASRIKDTGGAAGQSLQSLNAMADSLMRLTTFDDEAIGGVQAMLLTFKDIRGDEFQRATEAVLDLSTAMGTDLNAAALQVGKALQDPVKGITALSRAGVQFSEDQKKVIKSLVDVGDKAAAQELILGELAGQMGTAAEAARNTLGGALSGLKNTFDNLLEGDTSAGGLKGTVTAVNDLSDSLSDPNLKKGVDTLASGLLTAANAAIIAAGKLGNFISSYHDFLANRGFLPTDDNSTEAQLKARREKLLKAIQKSDNNPLFYGKDTAAKLRAELAEVDAAIGHYPWRNVISDANTVPAGIKPPKPAALGTGAGSGRSHSRSAAPAMPDFRSEDLDALRDAVAAASAANDQFDQLAATLSGPLAQAELEHTRNLKEIEEVGKAAGRSTEEINALKTLETEHYREQTDAIKALKSPAEQMLADMQAEYDLIGLSNDERARAIALRYAGAGATEAERQAIGDMAVALEHAHEAQAQIDDLKDSLKSFAVDAADGVGTLGEAWDDFFDRIKMRALEFVADKAINALFDMLGGKSNGSGSSGGGLFGTLLGFSSPSDASSSSSWTGAIAALFGGSRAGGGDVFGDRAYLVGEQGPEMFVPRTAGAILPADATAMRMGAGGGAFNQTINLMTPARMDNRTQQQLAQAAANGGLEARRRNGTR